MIREGELSEQEQFSAQMTYRNFAAANAAAGACSGEAMLILMAIRLNLPDSLVSCIGALGFLSYLVLPFGFPAAAKYGVGGSIRKQGFFIALLCGGIMLSGFLPHGAAAGILFSACLILLYFLRSSSASMLFPLQKSISTEQTLPGMLARNNITASTVGLAASLSLAFLVSAAHSPRTLPLIFAGGAAFALLSAGIIGEIEEPRKLKQFAARPILPQVRLAWSDKRMRKQLVVGCLLNLSLAMMLPVNLLAVRRGFGFGDAGALFLTSIQVVTGIAASWLTRHLALRYGPRNLLLWSYPLIWILALYWIFVPARPSLLLAAVPFVTAGFMMVFFSTNLANYFLISIPGRLQIGGTFLVFVVTGGLMGALGMLLNSLIFHFVQGNSSGAGTLAPFRLFYGICGLLFSVWIFVPALLPVKYRESCLKNPR